MLKDYTFEATNGPHSETPGQLDLGSHDAIVTVRVRAENDEDAIAALERATSHEYSYWSMIDVCLAPRSRAIG